MTAGFSSGDWEAVHPGGAPLGEGRRMEIVHFGHLGFAIRWAYQLEGRDTHLESFYASRMTRRREQVQLATQRAWCSQRTENGTLSHHSHFRGGQRRRQKIRKNSVMETRGSRV